MRIRLLGPVELWSQTGPVALGTPQQRCLFAALAITPRQTVPMDSMIHRVWGDEVPRDVRTVLYTYVSRLRKQLRQAMDHPAGTNGCRREPLLRRVTGGYTLDVDPRQVDLHRVRRLAGQARAAANQPDGDSRAAQLLARACELWTGPPLLGVRGDWADRVRTGLDHERLALLTERFEAAIRVGQYEPVIGPLGEALAAHPLAESLASLLMLTLHRTGRSAEALRVYGQLRRRLVDELGDEPGPGIRRLHEQVLRRDPRLDRPTGPLPATADQPAPPRLITARRITGPWLPLCQLPAEVGEFVGRVRQLKELATALEPDPSQSAVPVVAVTGPPGVGKTAVATRVAHQLRDRFPDGQWYLPLSNPGALAREPGQLLDDLLVAAGVDPASLPAGLAARSATLRARLADRRVLLLLDDAVDLAQIWPLLPGTGGAAVLITSRRRLVGLTGASQLRLAPLRPGEALALLGRLAGADRVTAEPTAAAEICAACGWLPQALRIAAARLAACPQWPLARLAVRLRDRRRRLDELTVDDLSLRSELARSHRALAPPARLALGRLARLGTGVFTAGTAATLTGVTDGERLLEQLVTANLVDPVDDGTTAEPRYQLPELVAAYAAELSQR